MRRRLFSLAALAAPLACAAQFAVQSHTPAGNPADVALAGVFEAREKDWRNGAVVYQVLPDRFAPSAKLAAKRHLYPAPKRLRGWDEPPVRGTYLPDARLWSHEIDFRGGELASLSSRLDHVQGLGADVLYLNPIHLADTNHKYDAFDYRAVSPEFGTRDDVRRLAADVHARGMKLVLDGVFNPMGRNAPIFQDARANPQSKWRDWLHFGPQYQSGARVWWLAENLPESNLENPAVRQHVYAAEDSVVRSDLRDGVDAWRLDVAVDIGFQWLDELTRAAHAEKPGSLVVGEIANYPRDWMPAVDGVMNFTLREIILRTAGGRMDAALAQQMIDRMVADADAGGLLKSWLMLDNHDTPRLATAMRAPMRWDRVRAGHPDLDWTRQLVASRKSHRALRVGNYRPVTAGRPLAFERYTDRALDTMVVVANPGTETVTEAAMLANSKLMNHWGMVSLDGAVHLKIETALLEVALAPGGFLSLQPAATPGGGYSAYKRVQ